MSDELDIELHTTPTPDQVVSLDEGLVVVASSVLAQMDAHVAEDTSVEHGGVMVGHVDNRTGATVVTGSIRALGSVSEIASLTFTHETWDHIGTVMEAEFPEDQMVGWYHSHPHFGIFLSDHDQFIHRNFFGQPWQIAYVRDPLLDQRGFFSWVDSAIVEVEDWQEIDLPSSGAPSVAAPPVTAPAAPPLAAAPAAPVAPTGSRRGFWKPVAGLLVLLVVLGAVVLGGQLLGGDDEPEPELEISFTPAADVSGLPGEQIDVGTVELVTGDEDARIRVVPSAAVIQRGDDRLRVVAIRRPGPTWLLQVTVEPDATPGLYDGRLAARICPPEGACVGQDLVISNDELYQFLVDAPAGEDPPPSSTEPAPSLAPDDESSEP